MNKNCLEHIADILRDATKLLFNIFYLSAMQFFDENSMLMYIIISLS